MHTLKRLLAVAALTLGLTAPAAPATAAPPAPTASSGWGYTNCAQSQGFGARVCLDMNTAYGVPIITIYTSSTTVWANFCACIIPGGGWFGPSTVWIPSESNQVYGGTNMVGGGAQTFGINSVGNPGTQQFLLVTQEIANYVTWFLADPYYEFVVTN